MRLTVPALVLLLSIACGDTRNDASPAAVSGTAASSSPDAGGAQKPAASTAAADAPALPLRVSGTDFVDANGRRFEWRGVTAFRLAEMLDAGREPDVIAYLDWARSQQLTVLRVLLMAQHLFELSPEAGRAALPRLLDLAKARGLTIEVVALADTTARPVDYEAHLREVGRIALEKGNAFVEIANEPGHATQDPRLHDPAFVRRLAALLPAPLIVALGSAEYDEAYASGDYATFHFPREREWGHVLALADGAGMLARWKKPVVNDEPIGAASEYREGRRDNVPERFAAAGALGRLAGLGSTFHYEGGLQARLPDPREAAALKAWRRGLALVDAAPTGGEFLEGAALSVVARVEGARAAYARRTADRAAVLLIDPSARASVKWAEGWTEVHRAAVPGVQILVARRSGA